MLLQLASIPCTWTNWGPFLLVSLITYKSVPNIYIIYIFQSDYYFFDSMMERDLRFKSEGFDPMEEDAIGEKDGWLDDTDQQNLLDASIFYDDFPPLPDFPCMSSSSSSSSTPALSKPVSSSSTATSASWMDPAALSSTASMELPPPSEEVDCIDVMENFGYMDLMDSNEIWDPTSVFQSENPQEMMEGQAPQQVCEEENRGGFSSLLQGNSELGVIFFEWLKHNKDYISAEDMRSIKLKRSTVESASKRLGSTKEGRKQLLKLILEWVEHYQLQKKRLRESGPQSPYAPEETADPNPNPNPNFIYDPNAAFPNPWMPPPVPDVAAMQIPVPGLPAFPPAPFPGYNPDPYPNPLTPQVVSGIPCPPSAEYPAMEHAQSWAVSPFPVPQPQPQFNPFADHGMAHQQALYGNPYQMFDPNGERMMRLGSSATKEARKKRMARQRRLYSHHHRHAANSNQQQSQLNDSNMGGDIGGEEGDQATSPGSWMYWSAGTGTAGSSSPTAANGPPADASQPNSGDRAPLQPQNYQRQPSSDRRQQQGWKTEKNLKFLLQKVLKQSDVGNLGRIVLPKKEAESHLPELDSRDGISIAMEDIGTSRVWNMKYRFWPNNKSRMYLLENTGDFVRVNGLQEGDFIVIYSDTKCGKYMIRGVKVRQPGAKLEGKKPARRNMRNLSLPGNNSSLAPIKQAVR